MQKRHFRQPQGAKKAGNLITDFLLGVPLHGGGYSVVGIDYTSKQNLNNAFRSVSMMYSSMSLSAVRPQGQRAVCGGCNTARLC